MTPDPVKTWRPNADSDHLKLTETALAHVKKQIHKRGKGIGLRLSIKKYGCTGYGYVVDIIDEINPDDKSYSLPENLVLAVDKKSFPLVRGTTIDYAKEGLNSRFKFINPNEKSSCGCGESFGV